VPAFGDEWPAARWFISARRRPSRADLGCAVFLYHEGDGYIPRDGGPAAAG
jgi:hypothetical protein